MDYSTHYDRLISRARGRQLDCYVERHHVIPKCMGGDNNPENLVSLTPEEHYVAHQLLAKMYPDEHKLAFAAWAMTQGRNGANKRYGWVRRRHAESASIALSGIERGAFTDEHRSKLSDAKKGRALTEDHKKKISESAKISAGTAESKARVSATHLGSVRSEETKSKISQALKGKAKTPEHAAKSAAAQRGIKQPQVTCPNCGKIGGRPIMARYHFDKCRVQHG